MMAREVTPLGKIEDVVFQGKQPTAMEVFEELPIGKFFKAGKLGMKMMERGSEASVFVSDKIKKANQAVVKEKFKDAFKEIQDARKELKNARERLKNHKSTGNAYNDGLELMNLNYQVEKALENVGKIKEGWIGLAQQLMKGASKK